MDAWQEINEKIQENERLYEKILQLEAKLSTYQKKCPFCEFNTDKLKELVAENILLNPQKIFDE